MKKNKNNKKQLEIRISKTISPICMTLTDNLGIVTKITDSATEELTDYIMLAIKAHHNLEDMSEEEVETIIEFISVSITLMYLLSFSKDYLQETRNKFNQFFNKNTSNETKRKLLDSKELNNLIPKNERYFFNEVR